MPPKAAARAWEDDEPDERAANRRAADRARAGRGEGRRPDPWLAEVHPFPERRTIQIRGQVAPPPSARRAAADARRRPAPRRGERLAGRPDRAAGWAVLLGLFLVLVAVTSAHGAGLASRSLAARMHGRHAAYCQTPAPRLRGTDRVRMVPRLRGTDRVRVRS